MRNRKGSIYGKLAWLLLLATFAAAVFFAVLNMVGHYAIRSFMLQTDYMEREDKRRIDKLQAYVKEQGLASVDSSKLTDWVGKQSVVSIQVYKDGFLVYDSNYPEEDFEEEVPDMRHPWENFHTVVFSDGKADVLLYGFYDYQFYNYAFIGELFLSFLLLMGIIMLGIRRTIRYILKLSQEIRILEGGDLGYSITVSGHDELSRLAEGLDSMRQSFREQTEREKQLTLANQRMVTEMSHDLRTPLTSIMLYTEILLKGRYKDEGQLLEYVGKIDQKARRMKQLSDHLFEYSLVSGEDQINLGEPAPFQMVFYDMLSEMSFGLGQQGFSLEPDFLWKDCYVRVNADYIVRIFDNITSNIVKYGDRETPVKLRTIYSGQSAGFAVRNGKAIQKEKTESTRIGLRNIEKMMEKQGGRSIVEQTEKEFEISLQFPCAVPDEGGRIFETESLRKGQDKNGFSA